MSNPGVFWSSYAALALTGIAYTSDNPGSLTESLAIGITACVGAFIIEGHASDIAKSCIILGAVTAPVVAVRWLLSKL